MTNFQIYGLCAVLVVFLLVNSLVRFLRHMNRRDHDLALPHMVAILFLASVALIGQRVWEAMR